MKNQACSAYERLSKESFLALLGNKAFKKENSNIYGTEDDEQYSTNKTRAYFEKLNPSSWSITSFDPQTRQVCVEVKNKNTTMHFTVVVPSIISKEV